MNTTPWIVGLVAIVVIGAGIILIGRDDADMPEDTDTNTAEETGSDTAFTGSITDLASRGGNHTCTFEHGSDAGESSGTVYISGTDMRGDFKTVAQGVTVESHMIQKDGFMYTWSPASPSGFKMKIDGTASASTGAPSGSYGDLDQSYSYECSTWSRDNSKFAIPAISFMEFSS